MENFTNYPTTAVLSNNNNNSSGDNNSNLTDSATCKGWKWHCGEGLILPVWTPPIDENSPTSTIVLRSFVYLVSLIYLLFGVGIITERIITAAEVISNHKRIVTTVTKSGEILKKKQRVWHPVVALILFAIPATSSPEILIPLIDTIKRDFQGSELGASLIVGSGAYHLFIITAICLVSSMDSAPKPIKNQKLFFTTSFFAIFAYLWVYLVLGEISPGVIELWEAVVTFLSFPVLIFSAWFISGPWPERFAKWLKPVKSISPIDSGRSSAISLSESAIETGEMTKRKKISKLLQKLRNENPNKTHEELEELAEDEVLMSTPRNAAFYRLHNSESIPNLQLKDRVKPRQSRKAVHEDDLEKVGFEFEKASCFESCGTFQVSVKREILTTANDRILLVDFRTIPGTAKPNVNFIPLSSQLVFYPGQAEAKINLEILSDGIFEETDKFFHLKLFDARYVGVEDKKVEFTHQDLEISIMDDDHCGVFNFEKNEIAIPDNIGEAHLKVVRTTGTRGTIKVPFKIMPGTAKDKEDYLCPPWNYITFQPGQQEAFIDVRIIDKDRFGKAFTFYIELLMPTKVSQDILFTIGDPVVGEVHTIKVVICEDEELKIALDRLLAKTTFANSVTSATWKDQLKSAFSIHLHEHDECTKFRTALVYCYYVLAFPWRLVIALLPPPGFLNGYISYFTYLGLMAIAAGLVGDCAHYLGCTVNIRDTITAITLIPIGMGLPDTFASRRAARFEKTADAAIGSITGSNAVSNFLGMGISWVVGASYRAYNGGKFKIPPADLGFSVMLYCTFASVVVIILLIRRLPPIRGELGGPVWAKHLTALIFFSLWILFVVLSVLENYCFIPGFQTVNKRY